jgi:hypothetical protein
MPIRVQNTGKRKIQFGLEAHEILHPKKYAKLNDDVAEKLIKMFPNEVIDIDNVANSIDQTKIDDLTAEPEEVEVEKEEKPAKKADSSKLADALKLSAGLKSGKKA